MLTNRNNKFFRGLSVILAIMVVVISIPFSTSASVPADIQEIIKTRAADNDYDTESFSRIYIGANKNISWGSLQLRSLTESEIETFNGLTSDANAHEIGSELSSGMVMRTDDTDRELGITIAEDSVVVERIYYVDVPRGTPAVFLTSTEEGLENYKSKTLTDIENGAFYYAVNVADEEDPEGDFITTFKKVNRPSLSTFTVNPSTRTNFCLEDEIPFALDRNAIVSPIGNDFVYKFLYAKSGSSTYDELSQTAEESEPYWRAEETGTIKEYLVTKGLETNTDYTVAMEITDGYVKMRSAPVSIHIDPKGELSIAVVTSGDDTNVYSNAGIWYYGSKAQLSVKASEIATVAYVQDPTQEDLDKLDFESNKWSDNIVSIDVNGDGVINIPSVPETPTQYTATTVYVRGYNVGNNIIQEKSIDLVCDTKAPTIGEANLVSGDADEYKPYKLVQYVVEDRDEDALGSGVAVDNSKFYLKNETSGHVFTVTEDNLTVSGTGRNVTATFVVNESGDYKLYCEDNLGNKNVSDAFNIKNVDAVAPELTVTERTENTWKQSYDVSFTVNNNVTGGAIADGASPIASISYKYLGLNGTLDENEQSHIGIDTEQRTFTVSKVGVYKIFVQDMAGNIATQTIDLKYIDSDAPSGEIVINGSGKIDDEDGVTIYQDPYAAHVIITVENLTDEVSEEDEEISDTGKQPSGIDNIKYYFDYTDLTEALGSGTVISMLTGETTTTIDDVEMPLWGTIDGTEISDGKVTVAKLEESVNAKFVVYAVITDKAGNTTFVHSHKVITDSEAPLINATIVGKEDNELVDNNYAGQSGAWKSSVSWYNDEAYIKINGITDDGSGLVASTVSYEIDGATELATNNGDGTWQLHGPLKSGEYTVKITAQDKAGNKGEYIISGVKIDSGNVTVTATSDTLGLIEDGYATVIGSGKVRVTVNAGCSGIKTVKAYMLDDDDQLVEVSPTPLYTRDNENSTTTYEVGDFTIKSIGTYVFVAESNSGNKGQSAEYEIDNLQDNFTGVTEVYVGKANSSNDAIEAIDADNPVKVYDEKWTNKSLAVRYNNTIKIQRYKNSQKNKYRFVYRKNTNKDNLERSTWQVVNNDEYYSYTTINNYSVTKCFTLQDITGLIGTEDEDFYVQFGYARYIGDKFNTVYPSEKISTFHIKIDQKAPTIKEPVFEKTLLDQFLETLTFGLVSSDKVKVTFKAEDKSSGVKEFYYSLTDKTETKSYTASAEADGTAGNYKATVYVDKEYLGDMTFGAKDNVDNDTKHNQASYLIIDSQKPAAPLVAAVTGEENTSIAPSYDDNGTTKGVLTDSDITFTLTPSARPASGIEGFYVGTSSDPNGTTPAVKISNVESDKETIIATLYDSEKIEIASIKQATYKITEDTDKKYYFFVKSNAGIFSDPVEFIVNIDKTKPEITKFEFNANEAENVTQTKYGWFFNADTTVKVYATDDFTDNTRPVGSGVTAIKVWTTEPDGTTIVTDYGSLTPAADGSVTVTIPADFKGNIYAYATDKAANQSDTKHPYGAIVESPAKHNSENHISFTKSGSSDELSSNEYTDGDIELAIAVKDTYSGIKSLTWEIIVDGESKANGTASVDALSGDVTSSNDSGNDANYKTGEWASGEKDINLVKELTRTFKLDYDSNDIVVNVSMTDNAGNTSSDSYTVNIDKTAPVIKISYDNNDAANSRYFKADRTITVEIIENNFTDELASQIDMLMLKDNAEYVRTSGFTKDASTNSYKWTQRLGEGVYSIDHIICKDLAGNETSTYTFADNTMAPVNFVIDETNPIVTITYDNNTHDNGYFKANRTVTVKVDDYAIQPKDAAIVIKQDRSEVSLDKSPLSITGAAKISTIGSAQWQYTFSEDAVYTFNVNSVLDMAGNPATISYGSNEKPTEFTLDKTAPEINVKYNDNATLQDPNYFKSYRTAIISITEKNFDPSRINASAITARDLQGNTSDYTTYINYLATSLKTLSNWTKNNDTYTQQIKLGQDSESNLVNAIFTFGLTMTDKAGNSNTDKDRSGESGNYMNGVLYSSANAGAKEVNTEFVIDGQPPENLRIEINKNTWANLLNTITFGFFFKDTITVTLIADDGLSGVASFVYTIDYDAIEGSTYTTGDGRVENTINSGITYEGNTAKASFNIAPQFRGNISFRAIDRAAAVSSTLKPSEKVVVDSIAPTVEVSYNNNTKYECADDSKIYYGEYRTLTLKVRETNFYAQDIKMSIDRIDDDTKSITSVSLDFNEDTSGSTPVYTAKYPFNEDGHYKVKITYNDRSGNEASIVKTVGGAEERNFGAEYEEEFIVDTIAPVVTLTGTNSDGTTNDGPYEGYVMAHTKTITVTETNFVNKGEYQVKITGTDSSGNPVPDPVQSEWTNISAGVYRKTVNFSQDGIYTFDMEYKDPAKHNADMKYISGLEFEAEQFTIDRESPTNVQISYNDSAWRKIVNVISGGLFFKNTVTVKVRMDETVSGLDKIEYICDVAEGTSSTNKATSGVLKGTDITKLDGSADPTLTYTYEATFTVDPQYRGNIKLKIYDKAGNITAMSDSTDANELIVDSNVPTWGQVSYANKSGNKFGIFTIDGVTKYYFNSQIEGELAIKEANFDKDTKLNVSITKDGSSYDASRFTYKWNDDSPDSKDTWKGTFKLNTSENGEYVIKLNYTDIAGNKAEEWTSTTLVIDTVNPKFEVSYDNNDAKNDYYFPKTRTATLKITEVNIKTEDIEITVTEQNAANEVKTKKPTLEWISSGNIHTATFPFNSQMHYKLDIKCKDLAHNSIDISSVEFGESKAPTEFYVDRVKPTGSIKVGEWSASVNGSVWDKILSTITFGLYTKDEVAVTIASDDDLSGVNSVGYIISPTALTEGQLRSRTDWTSVKAGNASFTIGENKQFIVYTKITDRADNVQYLSSDGIIIDQLQPRIDGVEPTTEIKLNAASDAPEYDESGKMVFNGDIVLDIEVTDVSTEVDGVEVYSGLNSVTYQILSDDVETQSGTLTGAVDKDVSPTTGLTRWQSDTITISADRNNTNNIRLIVTAIDNVGNRSVEEQTFIIDTTNPSIEVSYDNNSPDTMGAFYKGARTATVTITERNFNSKKVAINVTSTNNSQPIMSEWSTIEGATPDDTRHRITLVYAQDDDYKFDISYTDEAGNKAGLVNYGASINPTEFTIDRTLPKIRVAYDNMNAQNGNYFNAPRTATITIEEHNFETTRVVITGQANDGGLVRVFPTASAWRMATQDQYYATILFSDDAEYTFTVSYIDKAGNAAGAIAQQNFYIDNINPSITVSDVEDSTAYGNGSTVAPVITFTDRNFNKETVKITLTGSSKGDIPIKGSFIDIPNGTQFVFENIEAKPENDDIYRLNASVVDLSGRTTSIDTITFSVNRFGSTYEIEEKTKNLFDTYYVQYVEDDVVIIEYNVDDIEEYEIQVSINGNDPVPLEETDVGGFTVKKEENSDKWTKFTYIIDKSYFDKEGTYAIFLKSKDAAKNDTYIDVAKTDKKTDEKMDLKFIVDRTPPTVVVSGVTEGGRYRVESQTVRILVSDDNLLDDLQVVINGTETLTWTAEQLQELGGTVSFTLDSSNDEQTLQIICTDAAGNENDENRTISGIIISTSTLVQIWNNALILYGAIGIAAFVILTSLFIILLKRRKKKNEEEELIDLG